MLVNSRIVDGILFQWRETVVIKEVILLWWKSNVVMIEWLGLELDDRLYIGNEGISELGR